MSRSRFSIVAVFAAVAIVACASRGSRSRNAKAQLEALVEADTVWTEVTTARFVVRSDLPADRVREHALAFETIATQLEELAFPSTTPPQDRVEVVIVKERSLVALFDGHAWAGGFTMPFDRDQRIRIVLPEGKTSVVHRVFTHELVHRYVNYFVPGAPTWLNEGMAKFYEDMRVDGDEAIIGESPYAFRPKERKALPSASALLSMRARAFYEKDAIRTSRHYEGAWFLVSMLEAGDDDDRARFLTYFAALESGTPSAKAWSDAFAGVDVDARFDAYKAAGQNGVLHRPYRKRVHDAGDVVVRQLDDVETQMLHATLAARTDWPLAERAIAKALRAGPASAEAHYWSGVLAPARPDAEDELKQAVALAPTEPRYAAALVDHRLARAIAHMTDAPPLEQLRPEVDALATFDSADALTIIAEYDAAIGDPARGLPYALRAVHKRPSCMRCLDTLARLTFDTGSAAAAAALEERAVAVSPHSEASLAYLVRLRTYEAMAHLPSPSPETSETATPAMTIDAGPVDVGGARDAGPGAAPNAQP